MLKMIWCEDSNHGIGINNKLPWNIREEMQHFIKTTKGHTVVMGRKTYESIGKPLPNRLNFVLTNNPNIKIENVHIINDYKKIISLSKNEDIFIIGGSSIYKLFYPYADQLIISTLNNFYTCDEFLQFDLSDFTIFNSINFGLFTVNYYERKK